MNEAALYYVGGIIVLLLLLPKASAKTPTATVTLGDPTVSGSGADQLGGTDYLTTPTSTGMIVAPPAPDFPVA